MKKFVDAINKVREFKNYMNAINKIDGFINYMKIKIINGQAHSLNTDSFECEVFYWILLFLD